MKILKKILISIVVAIALLAAGFGFSWYRNRSSLEELKSLREGINKELKDCEEFVNQGSGEFDKFEYCKRFRAWADSLTN